MAATQEKGRRVVRAEQSANDGHNGVRTQVEDSLGPGRRVRVPDERRMIHDAGREGGVPSLESGREDDVVGDEPRSIGLGVVGRQRERLDHDLNVVGVDREIYHLTVGLDQGHVVRCLASGLGEAVREIVRVDPPGRRPGFGKREAAPIQRPAGPVRLVVGPVHEVIDVFPEHRHPARLNVEDVVPVVAFPVVCHPGVPVFGPPLDQHDLHGLPGELEKADRGSGTPESCPDNDNPARLTGAAYQVITSFASAADRSQRT